jgi:hypothetical protein
MAVRDELQTQALFQERYSNRPSPVARQIEQRVIGGDWGANGYTSMTQADTLARELHLSSTPGWCAASSSSPGPMTWPAVGSGPPRWAPCSPSSAWP